ncbi:PAS domain-containing protein [Kineococcus sp. GCM10028916]|uniref:PAS domain-containing protein n=1 Tax=Kineococcus sp. GCM10028916 TaxID=3273394 RepID=UPI0036D25A00
MERARHLVKLLQDMWGEEMPATPDPPFTILLDAVALDDEAGRGRRLVVQGDGLSYELLAQVVNLLPATTRKQLPRPLQQHLELYLPPTASLPSVPPALPQLSLLTPAVGTWELDSRTGHISWDARCADLLDVRDSGAPLARQLSEVIHSDDREHVEQALATALATGGDYDAHFRTRLSDGTWAWRHGSGRVVQPPDGEARILGLMAPVQ